MAPASRIPKAAALLAVAALAYSPRAAAFLASRPNPSTRHPQHVNTVEALSETSAACDDVDGVSSNLGASKASGPELSRRDVTSAAVASLAALVLAPPAARADIEGVATPTISDAPPVKVEGTPGEGLGGGGEGGVTMYKTRSGLKYIELKEGTGPSPRYGQLVSISYKGYVKLPDIKGKPSKLEEFDSDPGFLIKHGNGRVVPGLDEGLHTMKVGGTRRLIVPAKLGYVQGGLGPIPESPLGRFRLNRLLDKMVEVKGGNVVFDVTMRSAMDDEADQGYYEDDSLSPEDFETLRTNLQRAGIDARASSFKGVQPEET